ncbi:MAG: hypothetical protein ACTTH7_08585 [Treponema sp.]
MGIWYLKHTKRCIGLIVFLMYPLYAESLRNTTKEYFNAIDWEELKELAIAPLPEPFTIPESTPMPYADMIAETGIYPVLPKLGMLDYQNSPEELLTFFDSLKESFFKKSFQQELFDSSKPFLPFLTQHLVKDMPQIVRVFYARPSFRQDGSAATEFKLLFSNDVSNPQEQTGNDSVANDGKTPSALIAIEAAKTQDRWCLASILIKEWSYADSFKQN